MGFYLMSVMGLLTSRYDAPRTLCSLTTELAEAAESVARTVEEDAGVYAHEYYRDEVRDNSWADDG